MLVELLFKVQIVNNLQALNSKNNVIANAQR